MDDASSVGGDEYWDINSQASHVRDDDTDWDNQSEMSGISNAFSQVDTEVEITYLYVL